MAVIDSLISDWEMDEASGSALDSHGSNPLTDVNTVGTNGSGWRDFEADNTESFSHADNADLSTGDIDFSLEAWVQLESKTGNAMIIARKWDGSGHEYILWFNQNSGYGTDDRFGVLVNGSAPAAVTADNFGSPALATPYQLILRHVASTKTFSIAVDNGTPNSNTYSGTIADTGAGFYVGADETSGAPWDGLMRRLRFWKKTLTDAEVTWLYNGGSGRSYADIVAEAGGGVATLGYLRPNRLRPRLFAPGLAR